ncbi:phage terminase small subunit [Clostridium beijerinckii]|uniref:phage terminase small subunit n=1 Tax=Clostridium beijerinckii TaxID=1520 RepID=UPI00136E0F15|nr:phage terminase small subunit [Clostridium beijerinckii]MZL11267.1 terminase [Clostridium beijerinckii]MZL21252.1 terminase [Clostridium beijerinckii]
MARQRSPNRDRAFDIFKEHNGNIQNREIANILETPEKTISGWKVKDKWNEKLNGVLQTKIRSTPKEKKKRGAPKGSKNALGNKGGHGGPVGNKKAEKFGFFSKYLPEDTLEIIEAIDEKDPLDIIWENIQIQYAAILRAQNIMHVKNKDEMIKEVKKKKEAYSDNGESNEIEYEFQFAWDRQATFLNAQSRAMAELRSLIKQYDEMLHKNWDLATAEQKARIDKLNFEISNLMGPKKSDSNSVQIVDDIDD